MQDQPLKLLVPLLIFILLAAVDATSIIFAVPSIAADLDGNATESFWIGASFLLASCVSIPISSHISNSCERKNVILSSSLMLGLGSLIGDYAESMGMMLASRSVQGLGAGGLVALSYTTYGEMEKRSGARFLVAIYCFTAAGTVSGPFIGAIISDGGVWRWNFRINACLCVALGLMIYNSGRTCRQNALSISQLDYLGIVLFVCSVIPILGGLSLASSVYTWASWQAVLPVALGTFSLLLFTSRELFPSLASIPCSRNPKLLLGLRDFRGMDAIAIFTGALVVGMAMYTTLFFLPIYYRVIKQHSQIRTAVLLLPQTAPILPCALLVDILIRRHFTACQISLLGWICTSCGIGLLMLLDANKPVSSDVLLNLLSGMGMGILLPALNIGAKTITASNKRVQAQTLLLSLRYLGCTLGLVVVGIIFQQVLRHNLAQTKFRSMAGDMMKHSTTLVYSIRELADPDDVNILIRATQSTLRTTWMIMAITCLAMVLVTAVTAIIG